MDIKLLDQLLEAKNTKLQDSNKPVYIQNISGVKIKRVNDRGYDYSNRHRGNWFKPEYDLTELQIAQDADSYIFKAIQKKVNKFILAGWEIVGNNREALSYIKRRMKEIELVSGTPLDLLIGDLAHDLARYSNCIWVKARNKNASTGKVRKQNAKEVEPVAGYFILPFETLWFRTKRNGEITKILQEMPNGETKEFAPEDVIHFYTNKKPGFAMGTPELLPVLEDVALLRRLEENIEQMIDSNLNPLFHYTVGNDNHPERYGPDGVKETDIVKNAIEYMPSGGIFVSDHRHKIESIGAEGKALDVSDYLEYFKKRVFAGLGVTPIDMGEGDSANRSTASTLSKNAIQDVEALQQNIKVFIDTYVITELLLEGGFDEVVLNPDQRVEIKFGTVDKEVKAKLENQTIQLWLNKLISEDEARKRLGEKPFEGEEKGNNYFDLYEKPLAMLKILGGIPEEENNANENVSNNIARPANQHGQRSAPKLTNDSVLEDIKNAGSDEELVAILNNYMKSK